ncbi:class I SAM-dependent methyltransferase [Allorhizobium taibaishanense]|uniref:Methyltransferase n=1 Tax=Allorhizobium taibaishanense TaxID=887144 RepID=A0A1Q9AC53_9HYPH|nr:class I SAM-dependent methyltransferase [Allorhizobium taibaishanense]MBB4007169.1 hypothetical protein [Allorhizobium taibaishanense]OLP52419.1 hypothetical protein BJF91_00005 [Allorhizobium taibaishanense]
MFIRNHQGPQYREFIAAIARKKNARGYLEVGVRDGGTLAGIGCEAIGVDPEFKIRYDILANKNAVHLYSKTSDEFFRDHDPRVILGRSPDVIFLDGLHQFEYLLRDFINSERIAHRDSLILLDDCLPINAEMTERVYNQAGRRDRENAPSWTGDVWKMIPILKTYRPDLHITLVDTRPTGTVCLTNLDPSSTVLRDRYYQILQDYILEEMDEAGIEQFYASNPVASGDVILHEFNASLFVGP